METPKKQNAQDTSNTLKKFLQDEDFLRALELIERAEKNSLKNGFYLIDYE